MPFARLTDRRVIKIVGEESRAFLDRLVTCDLDRLGPGMARYGALLTPQGKIIADFVAIDASAIEPSAIYLDTSAACAADLTKRMTLYKLRAKLSIAYAGAELSVLAGWGETSPPTGDKHLVVADPRLPALGWRALVEGGGLVAAGAPGDGQPAYLAHRVDLGIPESGVDFAYNDAFPHEALMDQLGGVDFDKGCYVGQEVVSRMQHRGTARTRIVSLAYEDGQASGPGQDVMAGDRPLGRTGSGSGGRGLATLRLDRASDALAAGDRMVVAGQAVQLAKPDWVRFPYPGETQVASA